MYSQIFPGYSIPFLFEKKNANRKTSNRERERDAWSPVKAKKKEKNRGKQVFFTSILIVYPKNTNAPFLVRKERNIGNCLFVFYSRSQCHLLSLPPCPPPHTDMKTPSIFTVDFFFKKPVTLLYIVYLWIKFMTSSLTKKFTRLLVFVPFVVY